MQKKSKAKTIIIIVLAVVTRAAPNRNRWSSRVLSLTPPTSL